MSTIERRAQITTANPMGTDGFEFVEFAAHDPAPLDELFTQLGFIAVARHRSRNVTLYRQGGIQFILNAEPDSYAENFTSAHGPCACAMAFRVADAGYALDRAEKLGAKVIKNRPGPMELNIPVIEGIGGSLIYLVDRYDDLGNIYDIDFVPIPGVDQHPVGAGMQFIDHLTQ